MSGLPTVYIETTIPSFLAARPSNNLVLAGQQELTRQWWEIRRSYYRLCTSELVLEEASRGDAEAAELRSRLLNDLPLIPVDSDTIALTKEIMTYGIMPEKAAADAAHIALAARHGVEYLLTWNCRHIANAEIIRRLDEVVFSSGYRLPTICTPIELFGDDDDE